MLNKLFHTNWKLVQNLQYKTYVFSFIHVLYGRQLHMLTQSHCICVISNKKVFGVSLFEFHNIKKGTSSTYIVHGKQFLYMSFYLMKKFLVSYHTCHVCIQRYAQRDQKTRILYTLHHLISQIGGIINFSQFKEGDLVENGRNS